MKLFLIIYLVLFYGLAFFWRSYVTWRVTASTLIGLPKRKV
jgi:hypothetical protein